MLKLVFVIIKKKTNRENIIIFVIISVLRRCLLPWGRGLEVVVVILLRRVTTFWSAIHRLIQNFETAFSCGRICNGYCQSLHPDSVRVLRRSCSKKGPPWIMDHGSWKSFRSYKKKEKHRCDIKKFNKKPASVSTTLTSIIYSVSACVFLGQLA
jgi:hypothetical protein